jgi:hypothetical protein
MREGAERPCRLVHGGKNGRRERQKFTVARLQSTNKAFRRTGGQRAKSFLPQKRQRVSCGSKFGKKLPKISTKELNCEKFQLDLLFAAPKMVEKTAQKGTALVQKAKIRFVGPL